MTNKLKNKKKLLHFGQSYAYTGRDLLLRDIRTLKMYANVLLKISSI